MPSSNWYCTLDDLKQECGIPASNTGHDVSLELAIEAAGRTIDNYTNRRFYSATETRYYTARDTTCLEVDDLLAISALNVDTSGGNQYGTTLSSNDYWLNPPNASYDGLPYTELAIRATSTGSLPTHTRGVRITGTFGFSPSTAVPAVIKKVTLLKAAGDFRAAQQPTGFEGGRDFGSQLTLGAGLHPFIRQALDPFRRRTIA